MVRHARYFTSPCLTRRQVCHCKPDPTLSARHDRVQPFPVEADGRFQYDFLERFWRFPYLVHVGEEIAGFALVVDECPLTGRSPCYFMAEFFVLRAYRGQGVGLQAARLAMARHAGQWHIAVPIANSAAQMFWPRVIDQSPEAGRQIHFDGDDWKLFAFSTNQLSSDK